MTSVALAEYMTLEQAVDAIGSRLMPQHWRGQEVNLLESDRHALEEPQAVAAPAAIGTPLGRLNLAVSYLIRALSAGDVKAVVIDELGHARDFPSALWGRPEARALFRPGKLPDEFRIAVEGQRAGVDSRWVRVSHLDVHRMLTGLAAGPEVRDVEGAFRAWLSAKLEERAQGRPVSKNKTWSEAQRDFSSRMPYHAFERIWNETVPQDWRHPKRPSRAKPT